jgi:hypothetical protein
MRKKVWITAIAAVLVLAAAAGASTFGVAWSNERLTTEVKLLKDDMRIQMRVNRRQADRLRYAANGVRLANQAYDFAYEWSEQLAACMALRDRYEDECLEDAQYAERLP